MSSHERQAREKIQLMERRQLDREAIFAKLPRRGDVIDFIGDGKFRSVKKVIQEASDSFALPGDEVMVEYAGWLAPTDAELNDEVVAAAKAHAPFDSSHKFLFLLGGMQVIQGWDQGVGTMRVGERALFLLAPEHGYGASGAPPVIPPNSKLLFEIKLLSAKEPVALHGMSLPQFLGGLVALAIVIYYTCFFNGSSEAAEGDTPRSPEL